MSAPRPWILGALVALAALPALAQENPNTTKAQAGVKTIVDAVKRFHTSAERSPTAMGELLTQPADLVGKWSGPYLKDGESTDPWGKPYLLEVTGGQITVKTLGADGKTGGEGENLDVSSQLPVLVKQAAPAAATNLSITATWESASVEVGALAILNVTLSNAGTEAVEIPELAEDRQLLSFDVQLDDGRVFPFERITPSPYQTKLDWKTTKLEAGKSLPVYQAKFPALKAGKLTVTAHYGRKAAPRLKFKPPHVTAKPAVLEIKATAKGEDEVRIKMITSLGPIHLRLFPEDALGTCLHFARAILVGAKSQGKGKTRKPFYEGLLFHRVIPNFMIQGGCPLGNGLGDAGFSIPAEFAKPGADGQIPERLRHVPGRLSMAHSSHDDSAGTQFFICTAAPTHLDGKYTCFGEVTRGLDVALTISEVDRDNERPKTDVTIDSIRITPAKSK